MVFTYFFSLQGGGSGLWSPPVSCLFLQAGPHAPGWPPRPGSLLPSQAEQQEISKDHVLKWTLYQQAFIESGLSRKHRGIITGLVQTQKLECFPQEHRYFLEPFLLKKNQVSRPPCKLPTQFAQQGYPMTPPTTIPPSHPRTSSLSTYLSHLSGTTQVPACSDA